MFELRIDSQGKLSGPFSIDWKWDTVRSANGPILSESSEMVRSIEFSMLICRERGWLHEHSSRNWRPAISFKPLFRYGTVDVLKIQVKWTGLSARIFYIASISRLGYVEGL